MDFRTFPGIIAQFMLSKTTQIGVCALMMSISACKVSCTVGQVKILNANQFEGIAACTGARGVWKWCGYTICTVLNSGESAQLIQTPSIAGSLCHTFWPIDVFSAPPCLVSRLVTE